MLVVLLWFWVVLRAHRVVPGSLRLTDALLVVVLTATYFGVWAFFVYLSRTPRQTLLTALGTSFTVVIIIALLELPAALRMVHWTLVFRILAGEGRDYESAFVLDNDLSFRRIPNLKWSGRPQSDIERGYGLPRSLREPITFTYDKWGYRNATEMEQVDVALLGDSYVEGWYVSDQQTVAVQLESRLGRPVANLGIAGYGTLQELRVLKADALSRHPRVIVWFFFEGNDLYDDQEFENFLLADAPSFEDTTPHSEGLTRYHGWRQRSFVRNGLSRIRYWISAMVPNQPPHWARSSVPSRNEELLYFAKYGSVPWTEYETERWETAMAALEEGIHSAQSQGVHVLLIYIPTKYRVYRTLVELPPGSPMAEWDVWPLREQFRAFCVSVATPCLDLTESFERVAQEGGMPYAAKDTHWSPEGHATAAAEIERFLSGRDWLAVRDASSLQSTTSDTGS
ncbi:MAG: hypothetical protein AMS18_16490 [Gemmatimonas sp. SG8_17]|nr:MAG: hypothetical protein AMS18_16490 [Gemmatimonas sp. SG8_17]